MVSRSHVRIRGRSTFLALICVSVLLLFVWWWLPEPGNRPLGLARPKPVARQIKPLAPGDDPLVILNQDSCTIPRTEIMPMFFGMGSGAWHTNWMPECEYEDQLVWLEGEEVLHLLPSVDDDQECCVSEITRQNEFSDHLYNLKDCEPFQPDGTVDIAGKQMLLVQCGDHLQFEATLPKNLPSVAEKLDYWRGHARENDAAQGQAIGPISVLFLGFDSVSRSHAFRGLPRTLEFMTSKMGFLDFQGYHSIAPSTMPNYMGFLMGLTQEQVRVGCAPSWHKPFDKCPLIWKDYSAAHYVTMFLEDGSQTFNWGPESGFSAQPTDFYVHSLFNALIPERRKTSLPTFPFWKRWNNDLHAPCMSNETVPQFMLRHTRRFAEAFSVVNTAPFFGFIFFAYPFHDDTYSLPTMDDDFLLFMRALNENVDLLENTLIVLMSDHGDRSSFFHSASIEAYIERALPPLFIRAPEALFRRYPEFESALQANTRRLVSPFDLHHTFKHLLQLGDEHENFTTVLEDRSSLFVEVSGLRTCEQLHLSDVCVCNTATHVESVTEPDVLQKLIKFVEQKMNTLVLESGYEDVCAQWVTNVDSILSAQILSKHQSTNLTTTTTTTDVLFKFSAEPKQSRFEAKIRIRQAGSQFEAVDLLGSFARISKYGSQSFCIGNETEQDKRMKELCVCASLVK